MSNISFKKFIYPTVISLGMFTSCSNIESPPSDFVASTTTTAETTTTIDKDALIPFNDYEVWQDNDEYYVTIHQDGMEGCYYTISMLYGNTVLEYFDGDGFQKSGYGEFAGGDTLVGEITSTEDNDKNRKKDKDEDEEDKDVTTTEDNSIPIEELVGKDGSWTFKCVAEGTEYIEIKLINEFGDVRFKCQYTCIVDTHLEAHMYYTNINY